MILSDQTAKSTQAASRKRFKSLLPALLGLLVIVLIWQLMGTSKSRIQAGQAIVCDAEKVHGDFFVHNGHRFTGGSLRSTRYARSGKYSCEVAKGQGPRYGFGFDIPSATPGQAYTVRVWRLKNPLQEGKLVAKGEGDKPFYIETDLAVQQNDGWEQLELRFYIPYGANIQKASVYVYTNGYQNTYFDDLEIMPSDQWSEGAFAAPKLRLSIKPEAWKKLEKARDQAIKAGILEAENGSWAEATIIDSLGKEMPVKIRLKGDWLDHLQGDKWSFRIEVQPPNSWKRMITFSVHTPSTRYYLHEWLLHRLLDQEDVLNTRYDLVELEINGRSRGIYAYEEHFEKEVVEYRQRREGPIVKFSEEGFWAGIKRQLGEHGFVRYDAGHSAMEAYNADIATFKEKKVYESPALAGAFRQAQLLMTQYRYGLKAPHEVFDTARLAKYLAICDVVGGHHGAIWHNQRFYFNPVTGKLEPIGFDGFGEAPRSFPTLLGEAAMNPGSLQENPLMAQLFADSAFSALYTRYLMHYSSPAFMQQTLDKLYADWAPRLHWIQQEFPEYQTTPADFSNYALKVRSLVLPFNYQSVKAHRQTQTGGRQLIKVFNTHTLPVVIVGYGTDKLMSGALTHPVALPGLTPRRLLTRLRSDSIIRDFSAIKYIDAEAQALQVPPYTVELNIPNDANTLYFKPLGIDTLFRSSISLWPQVGINSTVQALFSQQSWIKHPAFEAKGKTLVFGAKKQRVTRPIIIPEGYKAVFEAGADLDFVEGAFFLSRSPIQILGTEQAPVQIHSSDGSAKGFTVLQAAGNSTLSYAIFEGLNTLSYGDWNLTGAVTFYESPLALDHCRFVNNHCEDALNTIRTNFDMAFCHFTRISSDGFDSDFCKGVIRNSIFENTVNDGVDFSGSIATIKDCTMRHNGDKGVSVGEQSDVSLINTRISDNKLAVASKDLSVLWIRNINIVNCDQGFVAYQKKPEFGPGRIIVESYQTENVRRLYAISEGCTLQLENVLIKK